MSPEQTFLARSALGLKDGRKVSYRNRFFCSAGGGDHDEWLRMVENGEAMLRRADATQSLDLFALTRVGAERALQPGERLDPEDFPSERNS
jgi:hypothetical protein